jgi:hypothetical protein
MPAAEWAPVVDSIIAAIATTPKSLKTICEEIEAAPTAKTFYQWLTEDESLRDRYARAKKEQLQVLADEIVDLADKDRICEKVTIKADGSREVVILDQVDRTRLQIDSRKWLLSKLDPAKYGDKQLHTGADGEGPVELSVAISEARKRAGIPE